MASGGDTRGIYASGQQSGSGRPPTGHSYFVPNGGQTDPMFYIMYENGIPLSLTSDVALNGVDARKDAIQQQQQQQQQLAGYGDSQ